MYSKSQTKTSNGVVLKKTICLNMIVKNEAHIISETFDNLLKHIPLTYWVISDTGSTDGTQQLIKDYFKSKNKYILNQKEDIYTTK